MDEWARKVNCCEHCLREGLHREDTCKYDRSLGLPYNAISKVGENPPPKVMRKRPTADRPCDEKYP